MTAIVFVLPLFFPSGYYYRVAALVFRMVLPIDEPSDALYRLITHELTHIFEFDIIPRSLLRRGLPLWVDEGLVRLHDRLLEPVRPDDGARRGDLPTTCRR